MTPRLKNFYLPLLLCSLPLVVLARFDIVSGPDPDKYPQLFCNESWVAWSNLDPPPYICLCIGAFPPNATAAPGSGSGLGDLVEEMQPQEPEGKGTRRVFDELACAVRGVQGNDTGADDPDAVIGWPTCAVLFPEAFPQYENDTHILDKTSGPLILYIFVNPLEPHLVQYFDETEEGRRPVICATPPPNEDEEDTTALLVVIYVTSSITIISSIAILVTYMLFKSLRTLSGLVIINLSVAFLLGDVLLQIRLGHEQHGIRAAESTTLNDGFFLARYVWTSLIGFEMCRSLYKGVRLDIGNSRIGKYTMLLIYMIIGWGIPAILTIIIYTVNDSDASTTVKNWFGLYLTQYVPLAVTQLINMVIVVFITVIFWGAIRRQRRLNSSMKRQNINFVRVFLILITALGLLWIMLFVLLHWRGLMAIQIVFVLVVVPQPLLVCVAFVCTKKVGRMYLNLLGIETDRSKSSRSRQDTLTSMYSEKELLKRGKTITSMVSEKEFNMPSQNEKKQSLHTINEENEMTSIPEKKDLSKENTALDNGKDTSKINGTSNDETEVKSNGNVQDNGLSSPSHSNRALNPDRQESPV